MSKGSKTATDWKRITRISLRILAAAGFLVTFGFTEKRQSEMICTEVSIDIQSSGVSQGFIEQHDVLRLVHDKFGAVEGKPLQSINISLLENIINNNPFVERAEVFSSVDGKLLIEVIPRTPVARIINYFNESFYIDEQGVFMPLSEKYSASVPVVSGYVLDMEALHSIRTFKNQDLSDTSIHPITIEKTFMLADFIRKHDFWNAQVEQVFVNADGDMELIPRVGNQTIVFGDEKEMDKKFEKLFLFYKEGISKEGWSKYSTINVKYKDQVVCTKKNTNGK